MPNKSGMKDEVKHRRLVSRQVSLISEALGTAVPRAVATGQTFNSEEINFFSRELKLCPVATALGTAFP
jgi:hypothetical protein